MVMYGIFYSTFMQLYRIIAAACTDDTDIRTEHRAILVPKDSRITKKISNSSLIDQTNKLDY